MKLREEAHYGGPFKWAVFRKLCRDEGFTKSILIVTILPVVTVGLSILFCCLWRTLYGKEGHKKGKEDHEGRKTVKIVKPDPEQQHLENKVNEVHSNKVMTAANTNDRDSLFPN